MSDTALRYTRGTHYFFRLTEKVVGAACSAMWSCVRPFWWWDTIVGGLLSPLSARALQVLTVSVTPRQQCPFVLFP
jgi:hypothetical protein